LSIEPGNQFTARNRRLLFPGLVDSAVSVDELNEQYRATVVVAVRQRTLNPGYRATRTAVDDAAKLLSIAPQSLNELGHVVKPLPHKRRNEPEQNRFVIDESDQVDLIDEGPISNRALSETFVQCGCAKLGDIPHEHAPEVAAGTRAEHPHTGGTDA